jgi:hypothetical protein
MSYVRSKMINGHGPYYYRVKSVREGDHVRQVHIAYLGKNPPASEMKDKDLGTTPEPKTEPAPAKVEEKREEAKSPEKIRWEQNDEKYLDEDSPEYKKGYEYGVGDHYYNKGMRARSKPAMSDKDELDEANYKLVRSARTGNEKIDRREWNEKRGRLEGVQAAQSGRGPKYGRVNFNGQNHAIDENGNSYKIYSYKDGDYIFVNNEKKKIS